MRRAVGVIIVLAALSVPASALAISGVGGNAAQVQYKQSAGGQGNVLNETLKSANTGASAPGQASSPGNNVAPVSGSEAERLPFTGYLVIGLLLFGVALLVGGATFRRSLAR
jgi:hypothetical protein